MGLKLQIAEVSSSACQDLNWHKKRPQGTEGGSSFPKAGLLCEEKGERRNKMAKEMEFTFVCMVADDCMLEMKSVLRFCVFFPRGRL